jgi:DNA primase
MFSPDELKDLIVKSGVPFKQNGNSFKFTCPKCNKPEKLWMLKKTGRFICFYCSETEGFKGKAEFALTELLGLPLVAIREKLYGKSAILSSATGIEFNLHDFFDDNDEEFLPDSVAQNPIEWPPDAFPIADALAAKGAAYLEGRGVPTDVASFYDIHYWPSHQRVLFPIIANGYLLGHQGRTILEETEFVLPSGKVYRIPKILTSATTRRDGVLMFQDSLQNPDHVIVCEGPIDAIKCHLVGGAVATMGKNVSREQIRLINDSPAKKVYVGLDPDAVSEIKSLVKAFPQKETYLLQPLPGKKDLGECSMEEVRQQFYKAEIFDGFKLLPGLKLPRFV